MAPERSAHALTKAAGAARREPRGGPALHRHPDGMTVKIDEHTCREPDALVRCGEPLPEDAVIVPDPLIVVAVLSPGTARTDAGDKLVEHVSVAPIPHDLVVNPRRRVVTHHRRGEDGAIATRIVGEGAAIELEPPGLRVAVRDLLHTEA